MREEQVGHLMNPSIHFRLGVSLNGIKQNGIEWHFGSLDLVTMSGLSRMVRV